MAVSNTAMVVAERQSVVNEANAIRSLIFHGLLLVLGFAVGFAGFRVVRQRVTGPIDAITQVMRRLASGELNIEIPGQARDDEISQMVNAVQVFKENALERQRDSEFA